MASSDMSYAELHHNRAPELAGSVGAFLAFAIIAVSLRMYVRTRLSKSFGYDDAMMVFTLINYILYASFVFAGIHYGTGQHAAVLSAFNYSHAMKMWYFCEIFYATTSTLVRVSIGMLLLRLTTIHWHRVLIFSVMIVTVTAGVTLAFTLMYQCQPIGFFWSATRNPLHGHCIDSVVTIDFVYVHGAIACTGDWLLGILPWLLVRRLNMNLRSKVTVGLLLCLANFGSLAMLIRFYTIRQIGTSEDFLYSTVDLAIWSNLEIGTAIPAASLITLRPLFRTFFSGSSPSKNSPNTSAMPPGFSRQGYIRHNTGKSIHLSDLERGTGAGGAGGTAKGASVTTTITGRGSDEKYSSPLSPNTTLRGDGGDGTTWDQGKTILRDDRSSDDDGMGRPLQGGIRREDEFDVRYSSR